MDCFRLRSISHGGQIAEPVIGRDSRTTCWLAMTNYRFRVRHNNPPGKSPRVRRILSSPFAKNIPLCFLPKSAAYSVPSRPTRGALRTSRHARWDAVDVEFAKDDRKRSRTAKSCGPDAPVAGVKFLR